MPGIKQPVILIHSGNPSYLRLSIEQAKFYNNEVIVLGDEANKKTALKSKVVHKDMSEYSSPMADKFESLYEHMSSNGEAFERFCFRRWFILLKFMITEDCPSVCYIDSDVMLYLNTSTLRSADNYSAAYVIPTQEYSEYKWDASAHISIWTRDGLKDFCDFIVDKYQSGKQELAEKWNWHRTNHISGGICDMTLLYLYSVKKKEGIQNLCAVDPDNLSFDNNVRQSKNLYENEYSLIKVRKKLIKNIYLEGRILRSYNNQYKRPVQLGNLHFQGSAKTLMFKFFQGNLGLELDLFYRFQSGYFLYRDSKSSLKTFVKKTIGK